MNENINRWHRLNLLISHVKSVIDFWESQEQFGNDAIRKSLIERGKELVFPCIDHDDANSNTLIRIHLESETFLNSVALPRDTTPLSIVKLRSYQLELESVLKDFQTTD